jgi:hypothetical protein
MFGLFSYKTVLMILPGLWLRPNASYGIINLFHTPVNVYYIFRLVILFNINLILANKIGIPDNILLKPGKFENNEFEIMKTHTTIGSELLSGHESKLLQMAREIAHTHHEKFNGTGYPQGLKGFDIPLYGRITEICDVFDALTSERPYKKGLAHKRCNCRTYKTKRLTF